MKKFIVVALATIVLSSYIGLARPNVAEAYSGYAMVVSDNADLFADASGVIAKFTLDKSYFVFVTDVVGDLCRVRFMENADDAPAIEGYVKTVCLSFYDKRVSAPYPDVSPLATQDAVMFSDAGLTKPRSVVPAGASVRYYGRTLSGGDDALYVYYRGAIGYVSSSAFSPFTVGMTREYLELTASGADSGASDDAAAETGSDTRTDGASGGADATKIIIVALLIVVGLIVLYFIIRPDFSSGKKAAFHDDE